MRRSQTPIETPSFSASARLPKALRLLILGKPGHARQCLAALAKVQGVTDITAVETTEDAFCAIENAPFDALMFDLDDLDCPIEYLVGPLKRGVLGADRPCPATICVAVNAAAVEASPMTSAFAPDVILKKPASFDGMRRALAQAAASLSDEMQRAAA